MDANIEIPAKVLHQLHNDGNLDGLCYLPDYDDGDGLADPDVLIANEYE